MNNRDKLRRILQYEAIGFLLIIGISWLDEAFDFSARLFGGAPSANWREGLIETIIVLVVWVFVHVFTKRLLKRLFYLEEFLRVCSWCRKVNDGENWVSFESFFASRLGTETTHGICPVCVERMTNPQQKQG